MQDKYHPQNPRTKNILSLQHHRMKDKCNSPSYCPFQCKLDMVPYQRPDRCDRSLHVQSQAR